MKSHKLVAIFLAVFAIAAQAATYVITGSGTSFTATKDNAVFGTANQPIQTVINAIGTDANGAAATIKFGNGSTVLDIGDKKITFDAIKISQSQTIRWGALTLEGKITAASECTICVESATSSTISITISSAEITNTGRVETKNNRTSVYGGKAIDNYNNTLTISGTSKVSATTPEGTTINRAATAIDGGTVTISGGTISATGENSRAISQGNLTVNGGTISASGKNSVAIYGGATIKGGTVSATGEGSLAINNGHVILTGNPAPTITGTINVENKVEVQSPFNPTTNDIYEITFTDIGYDYVVVKGGAKFGANFRLPSSVNGINLTYNPTAGTNASEAGDITITTTTTNGYKVTSSGTTYTITKGDGPYIVAQQAIDHIQEQASGAAATIQFGNGDVLDIGTGEIYFQAGENDEGDRVTWGELTLVGKISAGSINLNDGDGFATSTADITFKKFALHNSGTLNIIGGKIEGGYIGISNYGTLNITGGTIEMGVYNTATETCRIWDSNENEYADVDCIGVLSISGGTIINGDVENSDGILNISGGTINGSVYSYHFNNIATSKTTVSGTAKIIVPENSGWGNAAITIRGSDDTDEAFKMTGGTVVARSGYAVAVVKDDENFTGTVSITGGTLFAYRKNIWDEEYEQRIAMSKNDVVSDGVTVGTGVTLLAWDYDNYYENDEAPYAANTSTDLFGTAVWSKNGTESGIRYSGAHTGFIALPVTVTSASGNSGSEVLAGGGGSGSTSGSGAGINLSDSPKVTPIFKTETPAIVNISVKTSTNAILLSNLPSNAKVEVYNMQGKQIYSSYSGNSQILKIQVQTGIYIVKVNSQTMKIAVR